MDYVDIYGDSYTMVISRFDGEYFFLSNFYPCEVTYEGITYQSSEEAFQAQKTLDIEKRKTFVGVGSGQAKRMGRGLTDLRSDWEEVKDNIMMGIVWAKFNQNPDIKQKLLDTGSNILMEGNSWGDYYWGTDFVDLSRGKNKLGEILMMVRFMLPMVVYNPDGSIGFNVPNQPVTQFMPPMNME